MNQRNGPPLPRIVFQAMVRSRNDVKNGTITRPSSRLRHFPALKARK